MDKLTYITEEQLINYIETDLNSKPRHNTMALVEAINYVSYKTDIDSVDLMKLLLEDKPIAGQMTHSYGFHTHQGRDLVQGMQHAYYEEVQAEMNFTIND